MNWQEMQTIKKTPKRTKMKYAWSLEMWNQVFSETINLFNQMNDINDFIENISVTTTAKINATKYNYYLSNSKRQRELQFHDKWIFSLCYLVYNSFEQDIRRFNVSHKMRATPQN